MRIPRARESSLTAMTKSKSLPLLVSPAFPRRGSLSFALLSCSESNQTVAAHCPVCMPIHFSPPYIAPFRKRKKYPDKLCAAGIPICVLKGWAPNASITRTGPLCTTTELFFHIFHVHFVNLLSLLFQLFLFLTWSPCYPRSVERTHPHEGLLALEAGVSLVLRACPLDKARAWNGMPRPPGRSPARWSRGSVPRQTPWEVLHER